MNIYDDRSNISEGLDLFASSVHYDATRTLGIQRQNDGRISYSLRHETVVPSPSKNSIYLGLLTRRCSHLKLRRNLLRSFVGRQTVKIVLAPAMILR